MDELVASTSGSQRTLTLNRPSVLNALSRDLWSAFAAELDDAESDPRIKVLLIRGAGDRAFCTGADLDELAGLDIVAAREYLLAGQAVLRRLERSRVPSIAAVHGLALGGGFELALACSFILASDDAQFGLPEAGLGLIPGFGGTQRLVQAIGRGPALRVMLACQRLTAADAERTGLLAEPATTKERLSSRANELADAVATSSPSAVGLILEAVQNTSPHDGRLDHEAALAAMAVGSVDGREGVTAFRERRAPLFVDAPGERSSDA